MRVPDVELWFEEDLRDQGEFGEILLVLDRFEDTSSLLCCLVEGGRNSCSRGTSLFEAIPLWRDRLYVGVDVLPVDFWEDLGLRTWRERDSRSSEGCRAFGGMVEDGADSCERREMEEEEEGREDGEGVSSNLGFERAKTIAEEPRSRRRA